MVAELVGDPRFFSRSGPFSLADVAACCGAEPAGDAPVLTGVAPLQTAGPQDVSFLDNRRYAALLDDTKAGAVVLHPALAERGAGRWAALAHRQPYLAWARVCALFHPAPAIHPGRHATCWVDPDALVDETAQIGPFAFVGAGARIAAGCLIGPHASIGEGVQMGEGCSVGAHASVSHAVLGARVKLYPGVRVGQDGFGFAPDETGGYVTVAQLGRVVLEDDVEVGANSTIDRGSMHDTVIGAGSRLDNLVQIAHNVRLGRGCVIVSQVGISGSTTLGDHVMVAGQAGLIGHLTIGSKARIGAQAGVMADVAPGASVIGSPCQPSRQFFRDVVIMRRLADEEAARAIGEGARRRAAAGAEPE